MNVRKFLHNLIDKKNTAKFGLVFMLIFLMFSPFVFAQTNPTDLSTPTVTVQDDNILDCYLNGLTIRTSGKLFTDNGTSATCNLTSGGSSKTFASTYPAASSMMKDIGLNPNDYVDGGGLGLLAQVADYAYSATSQNGPDAVTFIASKVNPNAVSAQSSALQGLSPILVLWGTLRNVTYVLIALALVITGLSMYFQRNQGKQDNFNLATSVSDIVFTLITITISYVVAGIAVDLVINVGNVAIATFFDPFINSTSVLNNLYTPGSGTNIFTILGDFQNNSSSGSILNVAQQGIQYLKIPLDQTKTFLEKLGGPAGFFFAAIANVVYGIAQGVVSKVANEPLITAILAFTVFIIIFRIVFLLLGSFVGIIMTIAFAPLILIPGAFPGPSAAGVFSDWLKRVLSYALVFPVMFALLLLSGVFLNLGPKDGSCVYDNTTSNKVTIPGTVSESDVLKTTRFQPAGTPVPNQVNQDQFTNIRKCFPVLLPPKFNWLPAPIGSLGSGFDIDDFTRFVVGIAIILVAPNITKSIQEALKIKSSSLASAKDAVAGAGIFNTFLSQIPIVGKPISQITSGITGAIK